MSKKPNKNNPSKPAPPRTETAVATGADLLDRFEDVLKNNSSRIFIGFFILTALLVVGLFDTKISLANDDALYVEGAMGYAKKFFGYSFKANAPLYTMLLGILIKLFGPSLILLKVVSGIFFLVSIYFIYKTFKDRIPYTILFGALIITGTNAMFLTYAGYTYTECFFAMIQVIFLFIVLKLSDKAEDEDSKKVWVYWLYFGLAIIVMYMSRNVAIGAFAAIFAFFLVRMQWKNLLFAVLATVAGIVIWEIIKRSIWGVDANQFDNQYKTMMRKYLFNPNDPNNTAETPMGFVRRFWYNTEIYFGERFWELVGWIKENTKIPPMENAKLNFVTLFTIALMLIGFVFAWIKKNKAVLLATLYFASLCGVTFLSLHTEWAQARLVMIYFPYIFIAIFYGLWCLFKTKQLKGVQILFFVGVLAFMIPNLVLTLGKLPGNIRVLSKNIGGDEFYGYTPDLKNFFKASRWCARNLPEGSYVASRRAPMSFMYGDFKEFYPVYSIPSEDPDELLEQFRKNKVTHVLLAELRVDPKRYIPGRFISTLHRFVYKISEKYPTVFELVHEEGNVEQAQVYKIHYERAVVPVPSAPVPQVQPASGGK